MRVDENIPAIIDNLYAGTLDDVAWNRGMVAISNCVSGHGVALFAVNPITLQVLRDDLYGHDPAIIDDYRSHWIFKDTRVSSMMQVPVGEPVFEAKLFPLKQWKNSEIYNDYLIPVLDFPHFLSHWLHKSSDKLVAISIQGSRHRGPFDERDGERIKPLLPHVRRALEIKDRLELSQIRADTLAKGLDNLSFGVMILDVKGRILEASASAQKLMRHDCGVRRNPDGTLWLREPAGTELNRWVLAGTPPAHNTDGLLHVPRPLARPLSVMVTPLPVTSTSWISGNPHWVLLLFDPDRRIHASTELIARDLGISEREAEIAALLVAGYNLKKIAVRLNITINTARTHLKAIFAKTGVSSQIELIRRIASGPAMMK